jgi:putative lipoprotein (rSAM/lipoprotein system)
MAKIIVRTTGKFSRWALRLISACIAFVFAAFMSITAQAPQQIPGKQLQGKGKSAHIGTGLFSPKLDSLSSIQPAYGIVVAYGPCMALFSIKGVIRSKEGNAIPNCKVIVSDTVTKQGIDSTVSGQDGSFSFINEPTYCFIRTWLLRAEDIDGPANGSFNAKDSLVSAPDSSLPGFPTLDIDLYLSERSSAVAQKAPENSARFPSLAACVTQSGLIATHYCLPSAGQSRLALYNAVGTLVKEEVNAWKSSGAHDATISVFGLPPGAYFLKLRSGDFAVVTKIFINR